METHSPFYRAGLESLYRFWLAQAQNPTLYPSCPSGAASSTSRELEKAPMAFKSITDHEHGVVGFISHGVDNPVKLRLVKTYDQGKDYRHVIVTPDYPWRTVEHASFSHRGTRLTILSDQGTHVFEEQARARWVESFYPDGVVEALELRVSGLELERVSP
jgi:hypothetical protein